VALFAGLFGFALLAGLLYQSVGSRRGATRHPRPGELIDADGQRLHVWCTGEGTPVVLFEAGIAASSLSWTHVQPEVARFTRACAYDRAGLGWSDPAVSPRTVERMIVELRAVAAHAAPSQPVVLVGHSFGVFLALVYATRYPTDVSALVLLDPPTEWQQLTGTRARLLWGGIQLSRVGEWLARLGLVRASLALLTGGAPGAARTFLRLFGPAAARTVEHLVGEVRKLPPEVHPVVQTLWSDPKCFRGMAQHLAALGEAGAAAAGVSRLPDLPLVVLSGRDQPPHILAAHGALARLSGRGRHVIATGSGHWMHLDEPELVVESVREVVELAATLPADPPSPCAS
jgi:pimeloyl-ACP methyl ester carboxylesterase